jgi:hypothetical protein
MKKNERIFSNNDSPIVVSDTSTRLLTVPSKPETTVTHGTSFGKNAQNRFTVHDKSAGNKDDYRPCCLVFPSSKVPIPAKASSFQITYTASDGSSGILMTWTDTTDSSGDAGDITFGNSFISSGNGITLAVKMVSMGWSIDGGSVTQVNANGAATLVIVHYCPNGRCTDTNGKDPCASK